MTQHIDCPQQCDVPNGVQLAEVPQPRHAWGDVVNCPNDDCGRSFFVLGKDDREATR
ncbi:hypothetical protein AB0M57_04505 [Streptomyces sp. NPDC051597]|uniref:hypothetical protein n=1 Tax=Streptomyces sp. NPDC051597 TaxID=3155049 RepID=UPI0034126DD4